MNFASVVRFLYSECVSLDFEALLTTEHCSDVYWRTDIQRRRLIRLQKVDSAAYWNQILLVSLYLNCTQKHWLIENLNMYLVFMMALSDPIKNTILSWFWAVRIEEWGVIVHWGLGILIRIRA